MPNADRPFGRLLFDAETPAAVLALEAEHDRSASFAQIDAFVTGIVRRSLHGERVASIARTEGAQSVTFDGLDPTAYPWMMEWFTVERQQARGAWFLPAEARIDVGILNLPHFFAAYPSFAHTIAADERVTVPVVGNPEALATWAMIEPLFGEVLAPLMLRGPDLGKKGREEQLKA